MKPVFQTKLNHPNGNCLPACIASILELPLEAVPEITLNPDWAREYQLRLAKLGIWMAISYVPPPMSDPYIMCIVTKHQDGFSGHSVVSEQEMVIHDPHPSKPSDWLKRDDVYYCYIGWLK